MSAGYDAMVYLATGAICGYISGVFLVTTLVVITVHRCRCERCGGLRDKWDDEIETKGRRG